MPAIAGVTLATAAAGIKYKDRTDVLMALLDPGTTVAGVFTRSKCPSAPVEWCRAKVKGGKARALVVNSGNANAFTGKDRPRRGDIHRGARVQGGRLQTGGNLSRLHRRDRRAAQSHAIHRRDGRPRAARNAEGFSRSRQGDHDHRHLSEGRDRDRETRQDESHHQRHRQGRRHDRAGHGDDAVIRFHRRADRGAGTCRRFCPRPSSIPSTP